MRPCRPLLHRCFGRTLHTSAVLLAPSSAPRRSRDVHSNNSSSNGSSRPCAVVIDGEEFQPTEYGYGAAAAAAARAPSRRHRRSPAQLLADLRPPSNADHEKTSIAAVNPVELLLRKHGGDGGGGDDDDGAGHGGSFSGSGGGRNGSGGSGGGRGGVKRAPLTPPAKMDVAAAAPKSTPVNRARSGESGRPTKKKRGAKAKSRVAADAYLDAAAGSLSSSAAAATTTSSSVEDMTLNDTAAVAASSSSNSDDDHKSLHMLTNPLRGLHGAVARSYRIDQLMEDATPDDVLLARQERKSTAFSFLRFKAGDEFYKGHWTSLPEMQKQLDDTLRLHTPTRGSLAATTTTPYVRGTPIPGLTLFNNDLGLQSPLVQCSYPLILAQRMLLFPDHLRHFHAICGREDVPCDFFADVDLPGESAADAEKALLEVLNYLDVRLPGIGFTDPFFLVLTNAVPSTDKMSYHVHARSMTYVQERKARAELEDGDSGSGDGGGQRKSAQKSKRSKKSSAARDDEADDEADDYDDLSDMVNVVDNTAAGAKKTGGSTRLIAFQDYRTVKLVSDEVNQTLGRDVIDMNCYRPNGMLRCAFSSKLPSAQNHDLYSQQQHQDRHGAAAAAARKRLVPLVTASDSALQRRLTEMESVLRSMTDPEILEMTFCTRHMDHDAKLQRLVHDHAKSLVILDSHAPAGSAARQQSAAVLQATRKHKWKLIRPRHILGPQATQAVEYDAYGNVVSPFLTEGAKWRRYKAVTAKLRKLPPRAAESYDVWVRVGLALHNFSNEDNCFEEWVLFSLKSPQKYSRDVCRKKWLQFERNPDALNWRRGYNYLNSTVWRQV